MHIDTLNFDLNLDLPEYMTHKHNNTNITPPLVTSGQLSLGLELSTKMTLNNFINTNNQAITTNIINIIELESKKITNNQHN